MWRHWPQAWSYGHQHWKGIMRARIGCCALEMIPRSLSIGGGRDCSVAWDIPENTFGGSSVFAGVSSAPSHGERIGDYLRSDRLGRCTRKAIRIATSETLPLVDVMGLVCLCLQLLAPRARLLGMAIQHRPGWHVRRRLANFRKQGEQGGGAARRSKHRSGRARRILRVFLTRNSTKLK